MISVKDIMPTISNCPVEAVVNVAINDGKQTTILPASEVQILVNSVDGRKFYNLVFIHNERDLNMN